MKFNLSLLLFVCTAAGMLQRILPFLRKPAKVKQSGIEDIQMMGGAKDELHVVEEDDWMEVRKPTDSNALTAPSTASSPHQSELSRLASEQNIDQEFELDISEEDRRFLASLQFPDDLKEEDEEAFINEAIMRHFNASPGKHMADDLQRQKNVDNDHDLQGVHATHDTNLFVAGSKLDGDAVPTEQVDNKKEEFTESAFRPSESSYKGPKNKAPFSSARRNPRVNGRRLSGTGKVKPNIRWKGDDGF
jgi:hypothetical protein